MDPESRGAGAPGGLRERIHTIVYEADTPAGKAFDVGLIVTILLSVAVVLAESVTSVRTVLGSELVVVEWVLTALFTIEYVLRLAVVRRPLRYALSFYGVVDLLAILPTYLGVLFPGARVMLVVRVLRLLRVFRVLKLARYLVEGSMLLEALRASRVRISVFLFAVMSIVVIIGALMYVVEGGANGFTSIPQSIYWAIVTLTTVGYGDVSPATPLGKALASVVMVVGYGMIAVPTGIVTVELERQRQRAGEAPREATVPWGEACPACGRDLHVRDAVFCSYCGERLQEGGGS